MSTGDYVGACHERLHRDKGTVVWQKVTLPGLVWCRDAEMQGPAGHKNKRPAEMRAYHYRRTRYYACLTLPSLSASRAARARNPLLVSWRDAT
ncbi:hypothetical protein D0U02_33160 [Burkholderia pseudomallei]|nr:hypothetical protein BOC51_28595 [Burkholderia pseudomallei]EIF69301.1 hypothetical protein BP354E_5770 [Burkholderia pseudomallei 354e]EIF73346.1 hypothetical protein BP354A_5743 [Burkholderia pseudomallei 354a]AYX38928.1 hypothetical protein EGY15_28785 [Burkholderia pseudomallei]RFS50113.1 hypothetical protein D0U05_28360 [Burkholderia pseudomallei]